MFNKNSVYVSGSTSTQRPVKLGFLKTQVFNNSTTGNYTVLTGSDDFGRFVPTKATFHYNTADGTAVTAPRFHLGTTATPNLYISSGSLTINGSAGVKSNQVEHFTTFAASAPLTENTDLKISLFTAGSSKITGSFIVHGFFQDY